MRRSGAVLAAGVLLFLILLAISALWLQEQYLLSGFALVIISIVPFLIRFERKNLGAGEVVLIAILAAIAAVSRVPFSAIPNVQPASFVIIMTGIAFGSETGFMVGAVTALASNIFLGQGPWTPWQMLGWGLMGLTAGFLKKGYTPRRKWIIIAFGFIWGFIFGWIMNLWFVIGFVKPLTWKTILGAYAASFYFDAAHAVCNGVFISLFSDRWLKIMLRIKSKYGLLE